MQVVVGSNPHGGKLVVGAGRVVAGRGGGCGVCGGAVGELNFFLKK